MIECLICTTPFDSTAAACPTCQLMAAVPPSVVERARGFVGRENAVLDIDAWLKGDRSTRVLVGDAGSGKSAFMAWLAGAGVAADDPPAEAARQRVHDSLAAVHFCVAKQSRTAESLDPRLFAKSLVRQFSARISGYSDELIRSADRNIAINSTQTVSGTGHTVIGAQVELHTNDPASLYRSVLEPFARLPEEQRWVVLVDSLDEAELWNSPPQIAGLLAAVDDVPSQLRIIATTRPRPSVVNQFNDPYKAELPDATHDVRKYAEKRRQDEHPEVTDDILERIIKASGGNFLYAKTSLDYWLPRADKLHDPDQIPLAPELSDLYGLFLQREYGDTEGRKTWSRDMRPLFAALGTAQEAFGKDQIRFVLDKNQDEVGDALREGLPYLDGDLPDGPFDIYHHSFREYIFDSEVNRSFLIDEADAHHATADRFISRYKDQWLSCHDHYGLTFTPTHLAEAADASNQPDKHDHTQSLVRLIMDPGFTDARRQILDDVVQAQADAIRALQAACADDSLDGLRLIAHATEAVRDVERTWLDPEVVFAAAAQGHLERAERRLRVFAAEGYWSQAVRLLVAWIAAPVNGSAASALVSKISGEHPHLPTLQRLLERTEAAVSVTPPVEMTYPVDGWGDEAVATAILDRMRGAKANAEVLAELSAVGAEDEIGSYIDPFNANQLVEGVTPTTYRDAEEIAEMGKTTYLGGVDGPHLVAFAISNPTVGDAAIAEYIQLLSANGYVVYRNRSLWALLSSILSHPSQDWVLHHARLICSGALAGSLVAFSQALPIARLGLAARAGDAPMADLHAFASQVVDWTHPLQGGGRGAVGVGDTWGYHKRRLGAIAETYAVIHDQSDLATSLLESALGLPYGYAGFQSPACISLAESWFIIDRLRYQEIEQALDAASTSAHCIQDPPFCARTTSRFNAIALLWGWSKWWGHGGAGDAITDIASVVNRFIDNPFSVEFSARHRIGETYEGRIEPEIHLPFPVWARDATTPSALARLYERPLADFMRLNPDVDGPDTQIAAGRFVNVPDPGFPPHVAGVLSAHVVADTALSQQEQLDLLRLLVPVSSDSAANFDRVLARSMMIGGIQMPGLYKDLPEELPTHPDPAAPERGRLGPVGYS